MRSVEQIAVELKGAAMNADGAMFQAASRAGRSIGAMVVTGFGGVWLALWASAEFQPPWIQLAAIAFVAAVLFASALRVYRRNKFALARLKGTPDERRRSRMFNIINAAQWIAIGVVVTLLLASGNSRYILPSVICIIGLHFLPLGRLFAYRPHYVVGLFIAAWPFIYVPIGGATSSLGPLGIGVALWASAAWAMRG